MSDAPLSPRFDGQSVVVTGVGRAGQLGEVVARDFAQRGAKVAIIDRDPALAEERAAALRGEGLSVVAYGCDLTDAAAVRHLFNAPDLNRTPCEAIDIGSLERYRRPLPVMNEYDQLLMAGGPR